MGSLIMTGSLICFFYCWGCMLWIRIILSLQKKSSMDLCLKRGCYYLRFGWFPWGQWKRWGSLIWILAFPPWVPNYSQVANLLYAKKPMGSIKILQSKGLRAFYRVVFLLDTLVFHAIFYDNHPSTEDILKRFDCKMNNILENRK